VRQREADPDFDAWITRGLFVIRHLSATYRGATDLDILNIELGSGRCMAEYLLGQWLAKPKDGPPKRPLPQ